MDLGEFVDNSLLLPRSRTTHQSHVRTKLPEFNVDEIEDSDGKRMRVAVHFEDDIVEDVASTIENEFDIGPTTYDLSRFAHSFTFSVLARTTDVKVKDYLKVLHQSDILRANSKGSTVTSDWNQTPDVILEMDDSINLIEFCTRALPAQGLERAYEVKMAKYKNIVDTIRPLTNKKVNLFVLAVGDNHLVTNLIISENLKESLIYRYRVSKHLEKYLIYTGRIESPQELNVTAAIADLNSVIQLYSTEDVGDEDYSHRTYLDSLKPPDKVYVKDTIVECLKKCHEMVDEARYDPLNSRSMRERMLNSLDKEVSKHCEALSEQNSEFNEHMKSIVNFPFLNLDTTLPSVNVKAKINKLNKIGDMDDPTFRAWKLAVEEVPSMVEYSREDDDYFDELKKIDDETVSDHVLTDMLNGIQVSDGKPSEYRRVNRRVAIKLKSSDKLELAKVGIEAKAYFANETFEKSVLEDYRQSRKLSFHFANGKIREDIDEFFSSPIIHSLLEPSESVANSTNYIKFLTEKALNIYNTEKEPLSAKYIESLVSMIRTPLFNLSKIISDVATELVLSLRQNTDKGEFIIKKVKDYDLFLLIKTTNLASKIFFSLLWFNDDNNLIEGLPLGNVFKTPITNGICSWTEFVSLTQSKLENWNLMECRILSLIPFWSEFHGQEPFTKPSEYTKDSIQMIMLNWITAIADKPEIEQEMSLFRYIFMKGFQSYPVLPNPEALIAKFSKGPKSRLTAWVQDKLINYMKDRISAPIKMKSDNLKLEGSISTKTTGVLSFENLVNPYFLNKLDSPGQMINLAYIGYIQNKNLQPESNVLGKLVTKILVYEKDFTPEMKQEIGRVNKELFKDEKHMFNIDLLKDACDNFEGWLKGLYGNDIMKTIANDVDEELSRATIMDVFTTLKASSNFNSDLYEYREGMGYHRTKVMQASQKYADRDKTRVIDIIHDCVTVIRNKGCMDIDIFMKNQHGGLREIYVLGFEERVAQWFIEKISRVICNRIPTETMTHPDAKRILPTAYSKDVKTKLKDKPITVATSADAEKWNQNNYVQKLAVMLIRILPRRYHGIVWTILHMWSNKHIMIPEALLDHIYKYPDTKYYDSTIGTLASALNGRGKELPWAKAGTTFISTQTGFMQGILHYTSSLFHAIVNLKVERVVLDVVRTVLGHKPVSLIMQSSDDSCHILSAKRGPNPKATMECLYLCLRFKTVFSTELGIRNNYAKEVIQALNCYEYNSAFQIGPSRYEPDIKLLFASVQSSDHESFIDHQEEMYSQMGGFINVGGSVHIANYIQLSHTFLHYRYLGSSVTRDFSLITRILLKMPDPSLGFKVLDNPKVCGLPGFQYGMYKLVSSSCLNKLYKAKLEDISRIKSEDALNLVKARKIEKRGVIVFGNRQKYNRLKESMEIMETDEWCEILREDPALYFRDTLTAKEHKVKLSIKMCQPGVADKLSTGSSIPRRIASCVYVFTSAVMAPISVWGEIQKTKLEQDSDGVFDRATGRHSLSEAMKENWLILINFSRALCEEDYKFLFPFYEEYVELDERLSAYKEYSFIRKPQEYRRVYTVVNVFTKDTMMCIPPGIVCRDIWFRNDDSVYKSKYPIDTLMMYFEELKSRMEWLSESIIESLDRSPFFSIPQMVEWINSASYRTRSMAMIGVPVSKRKGHTNVETLIRQNFSKHFRIITEEEERQPEAEESSSNEFRALKSILLRLQCFPYNDKDANLIIEEAFKKYGASIPYNVLHGNSRANMLYIMNKSRTEKPTDIFNLLKHCRMGICGAWTARQKFNKGKYSGFGIWSGTVSGVSVEFVVDTKDNINYLKYIRVDPKSMTRHPDFVALIYLWAEENHIEIEVQNPNIQSDRQLDKIELSGTHFRARNKLPTVNDVIVGHLHKKKILSMRNEFSILLISSKGIMEPINKIFKFTLEVAKRENRDDVWAGVYENIGILRLKGHYEERGKTHKVTFGNYRSIFADNGTRVLNIDIGKKRKEWAIQQAWLEGTDVEPRIVREYIERGLSEEGGAFMREALKTKFSMMGFRQYQAERRADLLEVMENVVEEEIPEVPIEIVVDFKMVEGCENKDFDFASDSSSSETESEEEEPPVRRVSFAESEEEMIEGMSRAQWEYNKAMEQEGAFDGWLESARDIDLNLFNEDLDYDFPPELSNIFFETEDTYKCNFDDVRKQVMRSNQLFNAFTKSCDKKTLDTFFTGVQYYPEDKSLLYLAEFLFPSKNFIAITRNPVQIELF